MRVTLRWGHRALGFGCRRDPKALSPQAEPYPSCAAKPPNWNFLRYALGSLAECDTQLIIAEQLGYGTYARRLKAAVMSLTMGIRAYAKTLKPLPPASEASVPLMHGLLGCSATE